MSLKQRRGGEAQWVLIRAILAFWTFCQYLESNVVPELVSGGFQDRRISHMERGARWVVAGCCQIWPGVLLLISVRGVWRLEARRCEREIRAR